MGDDDRKVQGGKSAPAPGDAPRLLFQSVQFNLDGGRVPSLGKTGVRCFKLPVNMRNPTDDIGDPAT